MPFFVARIELTELPPEANVAEQYTYLASCLAVQGFSGALTGNNGKLLPTGTYLGKFDLPLSGVLARAAGTVQRAGLHGRIVVFETSTLAGKNLASADGVSSTFSGLLGDS